MNVFTHVPNLEAMTENPLNDLEFERQHQKNLRQSRIQRRKNRNLHSVKFPDDLEADYQQWKIWWKKNDNAALRHLVQTHPDLKKKP